MILPDIICFTGSSTFLRLTVVWKSQEAVKEVDGTDETYRYIWCLEDIFGDVSRTELFPDRSLDIVDQTLRELLAGFHQNEQHDGLVTVGWSPLQRRQSRPDIR